MQGRVIREVGDTKLSKSAGSDPFKEEIMLVLTRKQSQTIVVDGRIRITVLNVGGSAVRLGIEAPKEVPILREELDPSPSTPDRQAA